MNYQRIPASSVRHSKRHINQLDGVICSCAKQDDYAINRYRTRTLLPSFATVVSCSSTASTCDGHELHMNSLLCHIIGIERSTEASNLAVLTTSPEIQTASAPAEVVSRVFLIADHAVETHKPYGCFCFVTFSDLQIDPLMDLSFHSPTSNTQFLGDEDRSAAHKSYTTCDRFYRPNEFLYSINLRLPRSLHQE
ncbi:uncharacterized protein [Aegilops tauschii subsp. strangulata]|uniref:uncharacterized protein isoform X1 n=1 Tax=Aegilops tauschii subsp. strangulata TaxID=200361 RepID=UPI001ABCD43A|nr:uncharacterized protein LOC109772551 isoform X1 [Aegilops tauschii subsp. strangulata]XP_040246959.1 uncharacterized protein LOC109772551 isoform X1 [Aegilops tauschii subsp. strangulata]